MSAFSRRRLGQLRTRSAARGLVVLAACTPGFSVEGELGRPIALGSGDASPLLRLAFIDEGCPGPAEAAGGCPGSEDPEGRACQPLLLDTLAPVSALRYGPNEDTRDPTQRLECLEARSAADIFASPPAADSLARAVTRLRFSELPLIRARREGTETWQWTAGTDDAWVEPGGVLGGNALRRFAVEIRSEQERPRTLTLYREFPGSENELAADGRAFLPVQFPGRLLGREIDDRCRVGEGRCEVRRFDLQVDADILSVVASRLVLDACLAPNPWTVAFTPDPTDPTAEGTCTRVTPTGSLGRCTSAERPPMAGRPASLVVASAVPGLVLFRDSAERLLGSIASLPDCDAADLVGASACRDRVTPGRILAFSGWPSAGSPEAPLDRLRLRSLGLVPGLPKAVGSDPCTRVHQRLQGLCLQCQRHVGSRPPFSAYEDESVSPSRDALAILGEAYGPVMPAEPLRSWLPVLVVPESHPAAVQLRRDVAPDAIEPDGLLGTALFEGTEVVLDYTDPSPAVRISCLAPRPGLGTAPTPPKEALPPRGCFVATGCSRDGQGGCCYGLPETLLRRYIEVQGDTRCCGALVALGATSTACQDSASR